MVTVEKIKNFRTYQIKITRRCKLKRITLNAMRTPVVYAKGERAALSPSSLAFNI